MKTIESIAVATVRLFEAVDLSFYSNLFKAQRIFVSELSNGLKLAMASPLRRFQAHISKIRHAQNGHI